MKAITLGVSRVISSVVIAAFIISSNFMLSIPLAARLSSSHRNAINRFRHKNYPASTYINRSYEKQNYVTHICDKLILFETSSKICITSRRITMCYVFSYIFSQSLFLPCLFALFYYKIIFFV